MIGIILQDYFSTIPSQIFQVAPFPLVLIHLSRNVRSSKGSRLLTLLSGRLPRALGRTHQQD